MDALNLLFPAPISATIAGYGLLFPLTDLFPPHVATLVAEYAIPMYYADVTGANYWSDLYSSRSTINSEDPYMVYSGRREMYEAIPGEELFIRDDVRRNANIDSLVQGRNIVRENAIGEFIDMFRQWGASHILTTEQIRELFDYRIMFHGPSCTCDDCN